MVTSLPEKKAVIGPLAGWLLAACRAVMSHQASRRVFVPWPTVEAELTMITRRAHQL